MTAKKTIPKTADGIQIHCAFDKQVQIATLKEHPRNSNTHPEEQLRLLGHVIQETGWRAPITVSIRSGFIVKGHGRLQAAKEAGLTMAPIDFQNYQSEEAEIADLIADNRLASLAQMDKALLKDSLQLLDNGRFDLTLSGYTVDAVEELMTAIAPAKAKEDIAPEPPKKAKTKPGDIYTLGKHRLICGDSTDPEVIKRLMAGEKARALVTDPPYGVSVASVRKALPDYKQKQGAQWKEIEGDALRDNALTEFLTKAFQAISPALVEYPALYVCHAVMAACEFMDAIRISGFQLRQHLVWVKQMVLGRSHYHWAHEGIFYATRDKMPEWCGDRTATTVIQTASEADLLSLSKAELVALIQQCRDQATVQNIKRDPAITYSHPTQKPVALPFTFILNSSNHDDAVLDSFAGSGPVISACQQAHRRAYLCEKDPRFCDVIVERYANLTEQEPAACFKMVKHRTTRRKS